MSELRERIERALHNVEYTAGEAAASMSSVAETLREALALLPEERAPNIETLLRRVGEGDHYAPEVSWDNDRKAWNVEWLHMRGLRVAAVISDTGYPWAAILNGERLHGTDLDGLMAALDKYDAIVDTTKA